MLTVKKMDTSSKPLNEDPTPLEELIKQLFGFLVDEYGLVYDNRFTYQSKKMIILIQPGHQSPKINFNQVGEPEFAQMDLEWILKYFHGTSPGEHREYLQYSLEENMVFIAKVFYENSQKIINEFEEWWIPAQVFWYRTVEKQYKDEGQTERFLKAYKYFNDYLKSKGAI